MFIIVDYLTQNLIAVKHQCSKGDKPSKAKAEEVSTTGKVIQKLKDEKMVLDTNFQDADPSSKLKIQNNLPFQ